jgi:hypothetical protein
LPKLISGQVRVGNIHASNSAETLWIPFLLGQMAHSN